MVSSPAGLFLNNNSNKFTDFFFFFNFFFRLFYMYCSRWQQSKVNKLGGWRGGLARRCVVTARVTDGAMKKSAWDTED